MQKYFNVLLEFDPVTFNAVINKSIRERAKGYVCVVDGNVLATANRNIEYRKIINRGLINTCDGSSIAFLAGVIHKQHFSTYTGPEIFAKYVKENYKQYFLGSTEDNLQRLKKRFIELEYDIRQFKFESLPFRNVEEFDYETIATNINDFSPDIIWVSLGAPKQEFFINRLFPFVNVGVFFAIGAAFNMYIRRDRFTQFNKFIQKFHLVWLFRLFQEPKKQIVKFVNYSSMLPLLIINEIYNHFVQRN